MAIIEYTEIDENGKETGFHMLTVSADSAEPKEISVAVLADDAPLGDDPWYVYKGYGQKNAFYTDGVGMDAGNLSITFKWSADDRHYTASRGKFDLTLIFDESDAVLIEKAPTGKETTLDFTLKP